MRRWLAILCFLAWPTSVLAALSPGDRAAILAPSAHPRLDTRAARLPPSVRAAYPGGLADAGAPFQVTDVIVGKPLPATRIVWGARVGRLYILHAERGGIAHFFLVEAFDLTGGPGGPTRRIWRAHAPSRLAGFAEFQAAYRTHAVTEME